jgi:hypothetical protein
MNVTKKGKLLILTWFFALNYGRNFQRIINEELGISKEGGERERKEEKNLYTSLIYANANFVFIEKKTL